MSGSLVLIDEEVVSSAVASVSLTGINSDYDVYKIQFFNVAPSSDNTNLSLRVEESGTANTTTSYDNAQKYIKCDASFVNYNWTNLNRAYLCLQVGFNTNETSQGHMFVFNASNSSEYTALTYETLYNNVHTNLWGMKGGINFKSASAVDGIQFTMDTGNIDSGTFRLYGLNS